MKHAHLLPADSIATAFRFFAERTAGFSLPEWLPTPSNVAYAAAVEQLDSVVYQIIRHRRRQVAGSASSEPEQARPALPCHRPGGWRPAAAALLYLPPAAFSRAVAVAWAPCKAFVV